MDRFHLQGNNLKLNYLNIQAQHRKPLFTTKRAIQLIYDNDMIISKRETLKQS